MSSSGDLPRDLEDAVTHVSSRQTVTPVPGRLSALVLSPRFLASYELPESGDVVIGRSKSVGIYVDDPRASRRHAVLTMGPRLLVRDQGSSNGTRLGGAQLTPGVPVEIEVGASLVVGSTTIVIQFLASQVPQRRFWSHEEFEVRLEEECARATRSKGRFGLARLLVDRGTPPIALRHALARSLRSSDVVGEFAPSEFEILLLDTEPGDAASVIDRIQRDLGKRGVTASSALVHFPTDGKNPGELLAQCQVAAQEKKTDLPAQGQPIIADSAMRELYRHAEKIAIGDLAILILGETGVGKEVMAEELHRLSRRANGAFLRLSCASLSETLLESELFGHERGSFTDAVRAKSGLLETANGGTVFLDEIGELPMRLQVKLLRVIEEKRVLRVGGVKPRDLDVRFVAATNRDLEEAVGQGLFREDLYFRLAGVEVRIPPLRERPDDIEPLARMFLQKAAKHVGGHPAGIARDALEALRGYRWPGNVRELRNVIEHAALVCGDGLITASHLPAALRRPADPALPRGGAAGSSSPAWVEPQDDADDEGDAERERVLEVLSACGGNQSRAALELGLSRGALIRRLEKYGAVRPRKRTGDR